MANASISTLTADPGAPYYYTQAWLMSVEDHVVWLRASNMIESAVVSDGDAYRWQGDFYGYLMNVANVNQPYLWYLTLRLNNMRSPDEFGPGVGIIATVNTAFVSTLMQQLLTYMGVNVTASGISSNG